MTSIPTIVVVDDAAEIRVLVRTRLRLSGRLQVVGEGASGTDAVALAEQHHPALLLLDVSMPGMDGLEALPRVREVSPETQVVMYSGFSEVGLAERTIELGAAAFFEKSTSLDTLVEDLLAVLGQRARDPVDQGEAEPVLEEHLERFRELFEDAAIGMATLTLSGRIVRVNQSLATLFRRSPKELVSAAYADFVAGHAGQVERALDKVVRKSRDAYRIEHDVAGVAGRRVLATLSPVRDKQGRPLYLFLQVQDVSVQRTMEEELRQSEARLQLLVDAVEDYAIFMLDPDGRVASWNTGAQRIKGWTADEVVGRHFRTFYPVEQQERRHPEHELEVALAKGHYQEEGPRVRKDGSTFWAHVTITAVFDRSGRHVGFGKVTRDVTERLLLEEEQARASTALAQANASLEEANAQLQQIADDQSHFLAVTAHELRSPIGALSGAAEMLSAHWELLESEERSELLLGMKPSADRLRRLLTDLLTASRIQAGALNLDLRPIEVREQLETAAAAARRGRTAGDVVVEAEAGVKVLADALRLAQMVDNLIANALRHGAAPVVLSTEERPDAVDIVVRDGGAGVSPALQERLFERFATDHEGGTGLGLYIVRELARSQDGDASYRPEDGAFVITLPTARGEDVQG
jgi:PAS domain S-box-containing protein